MITATNSTTTRYSGLATQTNNNQLKKSHSPNFKGTGTDFATYFTADFVAIVAACGIVDYYFKKVAANQIKRFQQLLVKNMGANQDFKAIKTSSAQIAQALQNNPKTKRLGKTFQKKYEKIFDQPIEKSKTKLSGKVEEHLADLHSKVEGYLVKNDKQDLYSAIGEPFLKLIKKTSLALNSSNASKCQRR